MGREILEEIFKHLKEAGWLSKEQASKGPDALAEDARRLELFEHARVGNLIEFGRVVHAEMNALVHAARQGLRVRGRSLYCTTFPCHGCARHLIGAGIKRVVYIEPYPKSLAVDLYPDAIRLGVADDRVSFTPFTGVAPRRYGDFFGFGRRKDDHGYAQKWIPERASPRIRPLGSPWLFAESDLCGTLLKVLADHSWI
jgi:cytidine deaminase